MPSRPFAKLTTSVTGACVAVTLAVSLGACSTGTTSEPTGTGTPASGLPEQIAASGALELGAEWSTPPIIGVDPSNTSQPVGIAPDLAAAIGTDLGVTPRWRNMQWPAQLPGLQSGAVDALFGQISDTREREAGEFDLVPFIKTTESLLMSSDTAAGITSLADMCGKTVGAPVGGVQVTSVRAVSDERCGSDPIKISEFQGGAAAVNAVRSGAISAWLDTTPSQMSAVAADPDLTSVVVPDEEIEPIYTAIAVSKKNGSLATALAESLRRLSENGTYAEILADNGATESAVTTDEITVNPLTGTPAGTK
ncbi:transporter substrate-binding domain-containing protein [Gordonia sp. C13]|uniref:transporter substrate-binding domain-containing protein n=1 Tax=Gordonia sp. C13 TaxID=2935078 RepID=UPI00200B8186|nr:transporter substrate-binding domain-containing protein [Gordonia sp. C13]MCK8615961.1 transporter substrate-binding domain-containing protein [Gordonia sp. C13]